MQVLTQANNEHHPHLLLAPQCNVAPTTTLNTPISNNNTSQVTTLSTFAYSVATFMQQQSAHLQEHKKRCHHLISRMLDNIVQNRFKSCCILAACTYLAILFKLKYLAYLINKSNWIYWQQCSSLTQLQLIPQQQLASLLITDIQKKYMSVNDPANFIQPLIHFLQDITKEEQQIKDYLFYTRFFIYSWLQKIFFMNAKKQEAYTSYLARLQFIRHIFVSWMADQNILQYTAQSKVN